MAFISSLYGKSELVIIAELGDLIYQNPETQHFETADVYLSGNVRTRLHAAQNAGFRNHLALRQHEVKLQLSQFSSHCLRKIDSC